MILEKILPHFHPHNLLRHLHLFLIVLFVQASRQILNDIIPKLLPNLLFYLSFTAASFPFQNFLIPFPNYSFYSTLLTNNPFLLFPISLFLLLNSFNFYRSNFPLPPFNLLPLITLFPYVRHFLPNFPFTPQKTLHLNFHIYPNVHLSNFSLFIIEFCHPQNLHL